MHGSKVPTPAVCATRCLGVCTDLIHAGDRYYDHRGDEFIVAGVVLHEPSMEVYVKYYAVELGRWPMFVHASRTFRQYLMPHKHKLRTLAMYPDLYSDRDADVLKWAAVLEEGLFNDHGGHIYMVDGVVFDATKDQLYINYHPYGRMSKQLICTPEHHAIHYHKRSVTTNAPAIA